MKNKVYVERYAERLKNGDNAAVVELCECYINEYNAQVKVRRVYSNADKERLLNEVNRKGNDLADMIAQKTGMNILNRDWFVALVKLLEENSGKEAEQHDY